MDALSPTQQRGSLYALSPSRNVRANPAQLGFHQEESLERVALDFEDTLCLRVQYHATKAEPPRLRLVNPTIIQPQRGSAGGNTDIQTRRHALQSALGSMAKDEEARLGGGPEKAAQGRVEAPPGSPEASARTSPAPQDVEKQGHSFNEQTNYLPPRKLVPVRLRPSAVELSSSQTSSFTPVFLLMASPRATNNLLLLLLAFALPPLRADLLGSGWY